MTRKAPPPPPVAAPKKKTTKTTGKWEAFNLPTVNKDGIEELVPVRRFSGPRRDGVPNIDPHYVFRTEMVRELAWAVWPHDDGHPTPCLMGGPKGCGKTSLVMQLAARCNQPVFRINLNVGTTTRHLKGRVGAADGSTVFVPGIATMAMEAGAWLLLDEISGATPPVALCLFPMLEFSPPGEVILEDAQPPRYVERHPDFRVMATDNTIGAAQEETRFNYGGTNPEVNEALLDRFGSFIQCRYLDAQLEFDSILARVPGMDETVLEGMIRVARNVRDSSEIATGFSTRMVLEWARRYHAGLAQPKGAPKPYTYQAVLDIAYPAFLNKMRSKIEQDAIAETIRRIYRLGGV